MKALAVTDATVYNCIGCRKTDGADGEIPQVTPERWVQLLSNFLLFDSSTCEQPTADEMQLASSPGPSPRELVWFPGYMDWERILDT